MTPALEGSEWSAARPGRTLPPGKTWYPMYRRLGGPQGRSGQVRKISPPPGFDPRTIQPVFSRYTDCATGSTSYVSYIFNIKFRLLILEGLFLYIRDSADVIATRYGTDVTEIESRWGWDFWTRPDGTWGSLSLLYDGYRVAFLEVKRLESSIDHPPPSSAEIT
jgi:hypothetical protein